MEYVKKHVKVLKYMKILLNGNVNHVTIVVLNVLVVHLTVVPYVVETFTYTETLVSHLAQKDIGPIPQPILVILVTKLVKLVMEVLTQTVYLVKIHT